jgi:hypothetical protein
MKAGLCLVAILLASASGALEGAQSRTLLGGAVTLLVPAELVEQKPDDEDERPVDSTSMNFANQGLTTALSIGHEPQFALRPADLGTLVEALKQQFHYEKVLFSGIRRINGRDFAVIESENATGDAHYVIAVQTSWKGHLLYVTYQCTPPQDAHCVERGKAVVASIHLRD